MPLPVLTHSAAVTANDLVRLFHQSELDWSRHLGEETTLDGGTLISNPALPTIGAANSFHDARLIPGVSPAQLCDEVSLRSAGTCRRWTINPSVPALQISPLVDYLLQAGWSRSVEDILILRHQLRPTAPMSEMPVIPARASFPLYRKLIEQTAAHAPAADAEMLHLDDSHFEAILAIKDKEPMASIGVLISGEIGTLRHWFVPAPHRRRGMGRFMLTRLLDFCGRAGLRHVMTAVPPDSPASMLLMSAGFEKIGEWITYDAPCP
jgi:hypothetical protein